MMGLYIPGRLFSQEFSWFVIG